MTLKAYKGYEGIVTYVDPDADLITGEVANVPSVVTFQARSPGDLQAAFQDSVDDYLAFCQEEGLTPHKPFSGRVALRLSPVAHGQAMLMSRRQGVSLNAWLAEAVDARLRADGGMARA